MHRASFEKFTLGSALVLTALMAVSADASALALTDHSIGQIRGEITSQVSDWIETGGLLKASAIAATLTFIGIKFSCSSENTL